MFKNRFGQPSTKNSSKDNPGTRVAAEHPDKIDYGAPLSADTIFTLINSSMQFRQPLYLVGATIDGASLP